MREVSDQTDGPDSGHDNGHDNGWGPGGWDAEGDWDQASTLFDRPEDVFAGPAATSEPVSERPNRPVLVPPLPVQPAIERSETPPRSLRTGSSAQPLRPGSDPATPAPDGVAKRRPSPRRSAVEVDVDEDDFDDEDFPPPRRGRAFLGFLIVLAILAAGLLFAANWYRNEVTPPGSQGEKVTLTIPTNTSTSEIGQILHRSKIIGNPTLFRFYAQYKGKGGFEAGRYEFATNSSFDQALSILTKGAQVPEQNRVTIPEGFRLEQIADRVAAKIPGRTRQAVLDSATSGKIRSSLMPADVTTLEGFLFPETYTFNLEDDEATIVTRMVETFDQVADEVGLSDSKAKVGLTPYETLIVASLIEREAKIDGDRGKISRVIYNRLKDDTALQIDATLVYALGGVTRVLLEDLEKDGPYNTYTRKGLPPTPIAAPGKASLIAALNPEKGDWLYYVVTGADGSHGFAKTFKEHKANIRLAKERGLR